MQPRPRLLARALDVVGEVLAPDACAACDEPAPRRGFCAACEAAVERGPLTDEFPFTIAAFQYGGAVSRAIARAKYTDRPDLPRVLGAEAARVLARELASFPPGAVLVPVPLHARRLTERGYDQAARIAAAIARATGLRLLTRALSREADTATQAALDRGARARNVEGAFAARAAIAGRRVVLVDDVRTTGATLRACAAAVDEVGAEVVGCVVVALARRDGV